jgi:GTP-binding protein Era
MSESVAFRSGFVAVLGRPNVGKSTLVNHLVGQKVAIVSDKPQTTRNRILAVLNRPGGQLVLYDTPGVHKPTHRMNERMVELALQSVGLVDIVLLLADVTVSPGPGDKYIASAIKRSGKPALLGLNKIDRISKPAILPMIEAYARLMEFAEVVPFSALTGENAELVAERLLAHLPEGDKLYPDEYLSDRPERFFVAEMVREQILRHTHAELPYSTGVMIESYEEGPLVRIGAVIMVEKDGQKAILIGRGGAMLKAIGTAARKEIEAFLGAKVFLSLFVKVRSAWRED